MQRVSRQNPCPVCGKPDWCLVAKDGSAAICSRIQEGSIKRCGDAGWLHRFRDNGWRSRAGGTWVPMVRGIGAKVAGQSVTYLPSYHQDGYR